MRMSKGLDVLRSVKTPDGIGGYSEVESVVSVIKGYITPVASEVVRSEYGVATNKGHKVITKQTISDGCYLSDGSAKYRILKRQGNKRLKIYLVEVM